jgi:hypothetical protein
LDYVPQLSATLQPPHSAGSENGQVHADHIDPGLSTGVMAEGPGVAMMISQDSEQPNHQEKQDKNLNDLAMLTHIAAAASGR